MMKHFWIITVALILLSSLLGKESEAMKAAKQEAKDEAKRQLPGLKKLLMSEETGDLSDQDILPQSDQGKTFDAKAADQQCKNGAAEPPELKDFLQQARKRDELEENEEFLAQSNAIIQNPQEFIDGTSLITEHITEEEKLHTCQESGNYQVYIYQALQVDAQPEVKQTIKHCKGHEKKYDYYWKSDAEKQVKSKYSALAKDPTVVTHKVTLGSGGIFKNYGVTANWRHHDNTQNCHSYTYEEKLLQVAQESERWEPEDADRLASLETNPSCKLIKTNYLPIPESRVINGKAVFRDAWRRELIFSCEPSSNSLCAQLRAQGGILKGKKCLQKNEFGDCDLWEKIYDMGKKAGFQKSSATFKQDPIWGFNEFDSSYEKNTDFGQAITTLSVFSQIENNLFGQSGNLPDKIRIFKGEQRKCQKSFLSGNVFDCCKEMEGAAVKLKLAHCSTEEKCLAEDRHAGKCHFVGSQKAKLGTVTEHVYCCFPNKLARIVQEEGRKQLGIKWGSAESPKCQGLKLEEIQKVDFGKIDFSELLGDVKVDKTAYEKKLRSSVNSLQTKVQAEIEKKRLECSKQQQTENYEEAKESNG